MENYNDPLMQLHLSVAKIEGMLSTVIANHAEKIVALETRVDNHDIRLNEKDKTLAAHTEKISGTESDIAEIKKDNSGRHGRNLGVLAVIVSSLVGFTVIVQYIQTTGAL